jgi:hypothetical protein
MDGQENEKKQNNQDSNSQDLTITLAEFFAFGRKNQKIYFNESLDEINADLADICNTNKLISISTFSAKLLNKKEFTPANYESDSENPK